MGPSRHAAHGGTCLRTLTSASCSFRCAVEAEIELEFVPVEELVEPQCPVCDGTLEDYCTEGGPLAYSCVERCAAGDRDGFVCCIGGTWGPYYAAAELAAECDGLVDGDGHVGAERHE